MELSQWLQWLDEILAATTLGLLVVMMAAPPLTIAFFWLRDRNQTQHAVLRNFPLFGRVLSGGGRT
jgi:hypothetical protein